MKDETQYHEIAHSFRIKKYYFLSLQFAHNSNQ